MFAVRNISYRSPLSCEQDVERDWTVQKTVYDKDLKTCVSSKQK